MATTSTEVKLNDKLHIRCERSLKRRLQRVAAKNRPKLTLSQIANQVLYKGVEELEREVVGSVE